MPARDPGAQPPCAQANPGAARSPSARSRWLRLPGPLRAALLLLLLVLPSAVASSSALTTTACLRAPAPSADGGHAQDRAPPPMQTATAAPMASRASTPALQTAEADATPAPQTSEPSPIPFPAPGVCAPHYTVVSGDTLSAIARRCNTTVQDIVALNPEIADPDLIYAHQVLILRADASPPAPTGTTPAPPTEPPPATEAAVGNSYYVDSQSGSDANSGTSLDAAWRSLERVHAQPFSPGDVVYLRRGGAWHGGLVLNHSGAEGRPITVAAYGEGPRPVLSHEGSWTSAITIRGSWVVLEGVLVRGAHEAGVLIEKGASFNVVRDVEATDVGIGILVLGTHNQIVGNHLHDLKMVVNTPGADGAADDDDYGAVGVWLAGPDNEVAHNRMIRCIAPSHDYGVDGGAVEAWGHTDGSVIHHNYAEDSDGFLEVARGSSRNILLAHNVSYNNRSFVTLHVGGRFATVVEDLRMEHNTIVEPQADAEPHHLLRFSRGTPAAGAVVLRNNLFHAAGPHQVATNGALVHEHNLYHLAHPEASLGFAPGPGELLADPLLVDMAARDFRPGPGSPAIDAGLDLGYTHDYAGAARFQGAAPDLGALEAAGPP